MKENGDISYKLNTVCVWYQSKSIEKTNKRWYKACHELCTGKTEGCERYISKRGLELELEDIR